MKRAKKQEKKAELQNESQSEAKAKAQTQSKARGKTQSKTRSPQSKPAKNGAEPRSTTVGEFACQVIAEQFERITKQTKRVLADQDPEPLHQMRVGSRRLRTALQVFESAIEIPKVANARRLRDLARTLGELRDLDVQMASLGESYLPNLNGKEQKRLGDVLDSLGRQRIEAFKQVESALTKKQYQQLRNAYKTWLEQPQLTNLSQLPLTSVLPDLLSPLLSELLLHPGWFISIDDVSEENSEVLHDLRKACKHVRYQAEFFVSFYGDEFGDWVKEIKQLQDDLGLLQDTQVLKDLLSRELGDRSKMPGLNALIRQEQKASLSKWEEVRQKYLDTGFRYHLHERLLQPADRATKVHPELIERQPAEQN
ncbi:CHAD domain-containing protein [Egbenema bharatensis]|uniref:CHAD domain-containing protein n=1 Tax=Egbenema bharatensis TaxID=3463334 RepID=UPI003A87CE54